MIQCDICLCWQHGVCLGLDDEDQVPEKHLCQICKESAGARTNSKFSLDQDWLKEGKLNSVQLPDTDLVVARPPLHNEHEDVDDVPLAPIKAAVCPTSLSSPSTIEELIEGRKESNAFRKLSELMADLSNLSLVLHSLRIKLYIASQRNHSKVFMWSSPWNDLDREEEQHCETVEHRSAQAISPKVEPVEEYVDKASAEWEKIETASQDEPVKVAEAHLMQDEQKGSNGKKSNQEADVAVKSENGDTDLHNGVAMEPAFSNGKENKNPEPEIGGASGSEEQAEQPSSQIKTQITEGCSPKSPCRTITPPKTGANSVPSPPVSDSATSTPEGESFCEPASEEVSPPSTLDTPSESPLESGVKDELCLDSDEEGKAAGPMEVEVDVETETGMIIPSMSEVERLLPSLLEGLQQNMSSSAAETVPPPPASNSAPMIPMQTAAPFIPEQKRIDKEESRLNLVDHIDRMQGKVESCLDHVESQLSALEETVSDQDPAAIRLMSRAKSMAVALLHDVNLARKMMSAV